MVPLAGDSASDSEVRRARALLRRHNAVKRRSGAKNRLSRPSRSVRRSLRR